MKVGLKGWMSISNSNTTNYSKNYYLNIRRRTFKFYNMKFSIIKEHTYPKTDRVDQIVKYFDLQGDTVVENFDGEIDLDFDWNVGLIIGDSGSGKTTIAKHLFGNQYVNNFNFVNGSVIEDFPTNKSLDDIISVLISVGFSSPPSWLKPYSVLSMGEKMRVELCHSLLQDKDVMVYDEFTSVVDRTTAKFGCELFAKKIRKMNKKFVGISCHSDVIEFMNPDWIFDTNKMEFYIPEKKKSDIQLKSFAQQIKDCGTFLESITI